MPKAASPDGCAGKLGVTLFNVGIIRLVGQRISLRSTQRQLERVAVVGAVPFRARRSWLRPPGGKLVLLSMGMLVQVQGGAVSEIPDVSLAQAIALLVDMLLGWIFNIHHHRSSS